MRIHHRDTRAILFEGAYATLRDCVEAAVKAGVSLRGANLRGAKLPSGVTLEEYIAVSVPALLTAGGKTVAEIVAAGAWECHTWQNCPMHAAFGIDCLDRAPPELRPAVAEFVALFDGGHLPLPALPKETGDG